MEGMEDIQRLLNRSVQEKVADDQKHFDLYWMPVIPILQSKLANALPETNDDYGVAVDIGSNQAVGTATLALILRAMNCKLEWHPTDVDGILKETRAALSYMVQEETDLSVTIGTNSKQEPIYKGMAVQLSGLKTERDNGKPGIARRADPTCKGRIAVQLSRDPSDCKSFKQENLMVPGSPTIHGAVLAQMRQDEQSVDFYRRLVENTRELDVLRNDSWDEIKDETNGKCHLVTCTNLLTAIGYRAPDAWQNVMRLASLLLVDGGFLLQYDELTADIETMVSYSQSQSLGLNLQEGKALPNPSDQRNLTFLLWKKES